MGWRDREKNKTCTNSSRKKKKEIAKEAGQRARRRFPGGARTAKNHQALKDKKKRLNSFPDVSGKRGATLTSKKNIAQKRAGTPVGTPIRSL